MHTTVNHESTSICNTLLHERQTVITSTSSKPVITKTEQTLEVYAASEIFLPTN